MHKMNHDQVARLYCGINLPLRAHAIAARSREVRARSGPPELSAARLPYYLFSIPDGWGSGRSVGHRSVTLASMVLGVCCPVERYALTAHRDMAQLF